MGYITKRIDYEKITSQLYQMDDELWETFIDIKYFLTSSVEVNVNIIETTADYIGDYATELEKNAKEKAWNI